MSPIDAPVTAFRAVEGYISFSNPLPGQEALVAWHRAHGGGMTVVVERAGPLGEPVSVLNGVAVVDAALVGDGQRASPDTPDLQALQARAGARVRAVRFAQRPPPRTALLDRDGTIMEDRHYLADPEQVVLLPEAADGLRAMQGAGMGLVVLSNQAGVGLGRISPAALAAVNGRFESLLAAEGVRLAGIYCCPHRAELGCTCRKPAPGLARRAEQELGIDLTTAIMVGDKVSDLGLARQLGIPAFLVTTGEGRATHAAADPPADYVVPSLAAVARICTHPAGLLVAAPLPPSRPGPAVHER